MDPFATYKDTQRQSWAGFAPFEIATTPPAARLVRWAGIRPGQRVLDVACGTGVVAVSAARLGATVTGLDLTPELLAHARENAAIAGVSIEFHEGDVEALPFGDGSFDVLTSQYGHIFAPRPDVAIAEMLRVLRPGGTIAFSTWPPELFVGRMFALVGRYLGPPSSGPAPAPPPLWGDPDVVRERLGAAVRDVAFDRACMHFAALSPSHHRARAEQGAGPTRILVNRLSGVDDARLEAFRRDYDALAAEYFDENAIRCDYLMTRATKA